MARSTRRKNWDWGGRSLVAIALVSLVSIAAIVVWRRSRGVAEARILRDLNTQKRELISLRTTLERDLREAMSRSRIVAAAEKRLGMHVATELEVRNLPVRRSADSVP